MRTVAGTLSSPTMLDKVPRGIFFHRRDGYSHTYARTCTYAVTRTGTSETGVRFADLVTYMVS